MHYRAEADSSAGVRRALPPMSLQAFCSEVGRLVAAVPDSEAPALAAGLLPGLLANPGLLAPEHRTVPKGPYGRHAVFVCPEDRFSVLAMVWPAGVVSPVHDHLTWCAFGVYEGVLEESRYAPAGDGTAERVASQIHHPGDVGTLPVDASDIHSMSNPTDRATVSIHVYGGNAEKLGPNLKRAYTVKG